MNLIIIRNYKAFLNNKDSLIPKIVVFQRPFEMRKRSNTNKTNREDVLLMYNYFQND